jgi:RES domain-containing protein
MYGGRWNPPGMPAIYVASSRALAVLEILAHYAVLPRDFVMTPVRIPRRVRIRELPRDMLPENWHKPATMHLTQLLGEASLSDTAVLRVPSAIIPEENNYVLNPEHPDFYNIEFLPPMPFYFDARLK